ncbi:hypothetical protein [Caulobacter segnis]|uniref:Uncharacterized protein n=1 Tax=Caulobacter segnis TaxID=88688 RepID=A0A2W5UYK7_9CAUL|nr:hypothetical protein [Caulobacter segnis]PZR32042.1 MAG: hypothetical protein DI526_17805 [Caulobacter segnis]
MTTKAKNEPLSKQVPQLLGVLLASLLAVTAAVSAVVAPTDLSGRPLPRATLTASNWDGLQGGAPTP